MTFQGRAADVREVAQQLRRAGIDSTSGPLPGG